MADDYDHTVEYSLAKGDYLVTVYRNDGEASVPISIPWPGVITVKLKANETCDIKELGND